MTGLFRPPTAKQAPSPRDFISRTEISSENQRTFRSKLGFSYLPLPLPPGVQGEGNARRFAKWSELRWKQRGTWQSWLGRKGSKEDQRRVHGSIRESADGVERTLIESKCTLETGTPKLEHPGEPKVKRSTRSRGPATWAFPRPTDRFREPLQRTLRQNPHRRL